MAAAAVSRVSRRLLVAAVEAVETVHRCRVERVDRAVVLVGLPGRLLVRRHLVRAAMVVRPAPMHSRIAALAVVALRLLVQTEMLVVVPAGRDTRFKAQPMQAVVAAVRPMLVVLRAAAVSAGLAVTASRKQAILDLLAPGLAAAVQDALVLDRRQRLVERAAMVSL
jgi:hypothetical protein